MGSYCDCRIIPHRAERALEMLLDAEEKELDIGEECVCGSLIRFVMKTHHVYRYLRKVPVDDTIDDGYYFQETGEKQEITYRFATLDEVDQDFTPLFH